MTDGWKREMIISPFQDRRPSENPGPPPRTIIDELFQTRRRTNLSKRERAFLDFFAGPGKSITPQEFKKVWTTMTENEKYDVMMSYIWGKSHRKGSANDSHC